MILSRARLNVSQGVYEDDEGSPTLNGDQWTPAKNGSGVILTGEWDLPTNRWIEWMGTSLQSQLSSPYGAAPGYIDPGVSGVLDHFAGFTGNAFDDVNGRFYHFGGGHAGSANNMLTEFDCAKGTWRVVIPPTHQSFYPPGYATYGYTTAGYPTTTSGPTGERYYYYFPSGETTPGDDKPTASHEGSGLVYVPGIGPGGAGEIIKPRFWWFHAKLGDGSWRVGPSTVYETTATWWKARYGNAFRGHYLASTGLVYMTSESSALSGTIGAAYADYVAIVYNPVSRTEVNGINIGQTYLESSTCMEGDIFWYFGGSWAVNGTCKVNKTNLATGVNSMSDLDCTGSRRPGWRDGDANEAGPNPVEYCSAVDKILMWCTQSRTGEAQAGEMLEFNRSTRAFTTFSVAGTPPTAPLNMNNKMKYWPDKNVLVFQTATNVNARVIKLA